MLLIPAIDIREGRCVRLLRGNFARVTEYSDDPCAMALHWKALGARALHVVDLDGAREGRPRPRHLGLVRRIVDETGLPVQFGGGLRTAEAVDAAFEAGARRVVLGTAACDDPALLRAILEQRGDRTVVSVDCDRGAVMTHGWQRASGEAAVALITRLMELGVRSFIYTDVGRDGTLEGPDLDGIAEVLATGASVLAAGGIRELRDVARLRALEPSGLVGAIVGRAIYEGTLDFAAAAEAAGMRNGGEGIWE